MPRKSWDRPRRVIVKAEHLRGPDGGKSNPRFLVTNCAGDPRVLYEDHYCPRGDMENRIKEQQLGLFADRTSCHAFAANQFRVLLAAAAYVLFDHIRRTALVGSALERAEVEHHPPATLPRRGAGARRRCVGSSSGSPAASRDKNSSAAWPTGSVKPATPSTPVKPRSNLRIDTTHRWGSGGVFARRDSPGSIQPKNAKSTVTIQSRDLTMKNAG